MINQNINNGGIYRAFIISADSDIRIYIPGLFNDTNNCPINSDSTLNMEIFQKSKEAYPKPMWCIPNLEAKQHEQIHPCWVAFENGDVTRPIIMGFLGKGIKYSVNNNSGGNSNDSPIDSPNNDIPITIVTGDINSYLSQVSGTTAKEHGSASGTQCVELPNHYIETTFGLKNNGGFGNGKDYYKGVANAYPNTFTASIYNSSITLQAGDIISLRGSSTQYGHAAIVKSVNGNHITILEQWAGSGTVRESTFSTTTGGSRTIIGVARPK